MLKWMFRFSRVRTFQRAAVFAALALWSLASADAGSLRIVTYNIEADTGGFTTPRPGLTTVLVGIGNEVVNSISRPIDILSLQETTSNATTVVPILTDLNSNYGAGMYAQSPFQATSTGGTGGGPNAMVYNTTTLQLIASVGVVAPSTSGAPRQPVRYQFRPAGDATTNNDFYVYVSHMKAGTTSSDMNRRNIEALDLRTNGATLPASARLIYTGDLNLGSSSEAAYVTLLAAGQGQAFDPINMPGTWELNPAFKAIMTESAINLRYRDDFHLVTQNVMNDATGLIYISGSYHTFGVNGTTPVNGTVDSTTNTALPGLPNRAAVLTALTTASDHLPVVADYNLAIGVAPTVTIQPSSQSLCSGVSASISATPTGTPAPTLQWRKGTTNLTNVGNISGVTTATLTINPVGVGDAATNYNCVATNASGSATSSNATLIVFASGSGDVNTDGGVNGRDIQPFVGFLLSGGTPSAGFCAADMNHNGQVNSADVPLFVAALLGP